MPGIASANLFADDCLRVLSQLTAEGVEEGSDLLQESAHGRNHLRQPTSRHPEQLACKGAKVRSHVEEQGVPGTSIGGPIQQHLKNKAAGHPAQERDPMGASLPAFRKHQDQEHGSHRGDRLVGNDDSQPHPNPRAPARSCVSYSRQLDQPH